MVELLRGLEHHARRGFGDARSSRRRRLTTLPSTSASSSAGRPVAAGDMVEQAAAHGEARGSTAPPDIHV